MQGTGVPPISDIVPNKVSLPPTPAQRPSHCGMPAADWNI